MDKKGETFIKEVAQEQEDSNNNSNSTATTTNPIPNLVAIKSHTNLLEDQMNHHNMSHSSTPDVKTLTPSIKNIVKLVVEKMWEEDVVLAC